MVSSKFDCIKRICLTSKAQMLMRMNKQVVFEVDIHANKCMIKKAVEFLWNGLKVKNVAVMNVPGKMKRVMRAGKPHNVLVGGYKKAIVTLDSLDGFTPDVLSLKNAD